MDSASNSNSNAGMSRPATLLDGSSSVLHVQLANILREKIYKGEWAKGSKIPSEHELMGHFGISRGTVRRALKSLVDEGLLVQQHGKGTFVAEPGISHAAGVRPISFAESLHEQGKTFTTEVIDKRVIPAPADVAHELEVKPASEVMFMRRVRKVDGEPIICQESWSNLKACPGLDEVDFTIESLYEAVQDRSHRKVKYSYMSYTARIAGKEHASYLNCEETAAVLLLEQRIHLEDRTPIEWSLTWLRPGQSIISEAVQA